ncbi:MAG: tRNA pseudouridine(38-40) synthase TruA [Lachnospiraceae bacterium]|nr:tRNA pseudouridine(38-40) synthase TruA [Lachnospiraceae bacterium]
MPRVYLTAAYDGTAYHGSALQAGEPQTIEAYLNRAIHGATGDETPVIGASRTDAGVHARGAVYVFDTASSIPPDRFVHVLNHLLPDDIRIIESHEVPADFHPRRCEAVKTYVYRVLNSPQPDPTRRLYTWHVPRPLDVNAMREAAATLVGEHDFTSFCNVDSTAETRVRTILRISVERSGSGALRDTHDDEIAISVTGNGFLYNMVRIIAGTLVQIGWGWRDASQMAEILSAKDRGAAGCTAPPQGLFLIGYEWITDDNGAIMVKI